MFQRIILLHFTSFIYVGTPTFRHLLGSNNFIQNGKPLGWQGGSDGQEYFFGLDYYDNNNIIFLYLLDIAVVVKNQSLVKNL